MGEPGDVDGVDGVDEVDGSAVVRFSRSGFMVGAGVLLTPEVIATCAHVVSEAAGLDDLPATGPVETLEVDFPFAPHRPRRRVTVSHWAPPAAGGSGDIALLRVDAPVPVSIPPVRRDRNNWGKSFTTAGFPPDRGDGAWAAGEFRAPQGSGWLQLVASGAETIGPGFSGAPVWDAGQRTVVAMAVAADLSREFEGGAYALPIERVLALAPELVANPYRGLAPFGEGDEEFFFGRTREVAEGIATLTEHGLLVLAGGSGSGKSSLLAAGIAPASRRLGRAVGAVRLAGVRSPAAVVAAFAAALDAVVPRPTAWRSRLDRLRDPDGSPGDLTGDLEGTRPLLTVDQLEELATITRREVSTTGRQDRPAAGEALEPHPAVVEQSPLEMAVALIVDLARAGVWVAVTARWATFDGLPGGTAASTLQQATVAVTQLGRTELRAAVTEPAARVPGPAFDRGLVDAIVDAARDEPGRLPLVAALLARLWASSNSGRLTRADYDNSAGVDGALVAEAEASWDDLPDAQRPAAHAALVAMTAATDAGFVRRPAPLPLVTDPRRQVIDRLVRARLVVIDPGPEGEITELAHQALIDHWPRLRGWLTDDAEFLRWQTGLRAAVQRWAPTRDPGALLRGVDLEIARGWTRRRGTDLQPGERELIDASERRRRRDRRVRVGAVAAVVVLALVASGLTIVVSRANSSLRAALATANARSLAQVSRARLTADAPTATELALAAYAADPDDADARSALGQAYLARLATTGEFPLPDGVGAAERGVTVDAGPAADTTVIGTASGALVVDGLAAGHPTVGPVPGVTGEIRPLLVTGHGRFVVLSDVDGNMRVWDRTRADPPRALLGRRTGLSATSDGLHLLSSFTVPGGSLTQVEDLLTGTSTPLLRLPEPSVAVSPTTDPNRVLVRVKSVEGAGQGGPRTIRDVSTGAVVGSVPPTAALADGGLMVDCTESTDPATGGVLTVSDTATGAVLRRVDPVGLYPGCEARNSMITADGRHVAWLDSAGRPEQTGMESVQLLDIATGERTSTSVPRSSGLDGGDPRSPEPVSVGSTEKIRGTGLLSVTSDQALVVDGSEIDRIALSRTPSWRDTGDEDHPGAAFLGGGGSYALLAQDGEELARTVVPATGQVLGRLTRTEAGLRPDERVHTGYGAAGGYVLVVDGPTGRRLLDYTLPALTPTGVYPLDGAGAGGLPEPSSQRNIALARTPDHLLALSGGVLSRWSTRTHTLTDPLVTLSTDPDVVEALDERNASLELADPAGDAVALADRQGIDLRTLRDPGPRELRLDLLSGAGALAVLGDRVVALQSPGTINLYDRASLTPVAAPAGLPLYSQILGTDTVGDIVTIDTGTGPTIMRFWSAVDLTPRGQLELNDYASDSSIVGAQWVNDRSGDITQLDVDADAWRDHLCQVQDRAFSPAEVSLLPRGADTAPPCHQS